ncbi:MAG: glycosyltransferase family 4 protein [archaeon]
MKIAVASELFPPYLAGGGERRYYEILKRLAKKHEVHVYTMRIEGARKEEVLDGIHVHRLGIPHPLNRRKYLPLLVYMMRLNSAMRKYDFDIFDGNAYVSAMSGFYIAKYRKRPKVLTIHDIYGNKWGEYTHPLLGPVGKFIENTLLKLDFDRVITVSDATKRLLIESRVPESKIRVIYNGVDIKRFSGMKATREEGKFIYVGRVVEQKNIADLLRAFKIVHGKKPDTRLVIAGSGKDDKQFLCMARDMGLSDSVEFRGFMEPNALVKEIASAAALINPSRQEGFGLALLEAMCAGTPVVAYDLGAYGAFAESGKNCILVRGRHEALAQGMLKVLDKKRWGMLSANGKKTAKKFAWEEAAKRTEKLYLEVIEENG